MVNASVSGADEATLADSSSVLGTTTINDVIVILGSSREDSNTLRAVKENCPFPNYELVSLHALTIHPYRYGHQVNAQDDFLLVAKRMSGAKVIIFATPVYWYAMSGLMKNFFDRLTELLTTYKPIGKSIAGKDVCLISTGSEPTLPECFETPFKSTAGYFDMNYKGSKYKQS